MRTFEAWEVGKPLLNRLPEDGYQNNEVSSWLTTPWDEFSIGTKNKLDDLPRQLNPLTCDESWLDYLALLLGFTGEYWSKSYPVTVKRTLLNAAWSFLWEKRGTREVLEFVLETFLGAGKFDVWTQGEFVVDASLLDVATIGTPELGYFVRVPVEFQRNSYQFKTANQVNRLYGAAYCDTDVVYDGFYIDFSVVGDPVFDEADTILSER
ncbi:hypothetical protein BLD44_028450 [Mastigocladus laminosus UU774]|nr:hypothetical protein BLD44_028450 [Mastigocladus laminosus UU774]